MNSIKELIEKSNELGSVYQAAIAYEKRESGLSELELIEKMKRQLKVMKQTVEIGNEGVSSHTGLTGGDAKKLDDYIKSGKGLCDRTMLTAVRNAISTNEVNASMGMVCATPTAGSAGVIPGVLMSLIERLDLSVEKQVEFLFVAAIFGLVIANNASISGAMGGCQAEVGSASAMASAASVYVMGGTPEMSAEAMSITIKNMLGLICDPVAGLVEVPCVKRNALGASQALVSCDMAMAGIKSRIPADEVIMAMDAVGKVMPNIFKETAQGGLAITPTAKKLEKDIFGN